MIEVHLRYSVPTNLGKAKDALDEANVLVNTVDDPDFLVGGGGLGVVRDREAYLVEGSVA